MKYTAACIYVIITILFQSCEKEKSVFEEKMFEKETIMKSVQYQGLTAQMPEEYPDELINYNYSDLKQIASISGKSGNSNLRVVSGNSFEEIVENVKRKYPDFENAEPSAYRKFFPDLSERELIEKRDVIFQYMEKLMGYEVAAAMATLGKQIEWTEPDKRTLYTLTACEQWYYASHLRLDLDGMRTARDLAQAKAGLNLDDRQDANRHASWNVYLGKYAAYRYGTVNEAMGVVLGLTEAHECDTPQINALSKDMDLYNNLVGLQYFVQIAERYKKNIFDHNVRVNKSDDEIFTYISSLSDRIVATSAEIDNGSPLNILVKLK